MIFKKWQYAGTPDIILCLKADNEFNFRGTNNMISAPRVNIFEKTS